MQKIQYNYSYITSYAWALYRRYSYTWADSMALSWKIYKRKLLKFLLRNRGKVAFQFVKKSTGKVRFAIGSTNEGILIDNNALSKNPLYEVPNTGIEGLQNYYDHTVGAWRRFDWETFDKILYIAE